MKKMICPIRIIVNDCIFMCRKDYMSNQKPQWCISFTPSFQPFKGACSPLCFVSCFAVNSNRKFVESQNWSKGESFSKKTSDKQSRNWNRIALYNLFHSHWWEKNCKTTSRMEKYINLCCTFNRSYFVLGV